MDVLLTNDDGIGSSGLLALERALRDAGHTVTVVAPDGDQSATSHSITLFAPLFIQKHRLNGSTTSSYSVTGTPTDCGKLALTELLQDHPPDLVLSGINIGANLGANVFYSGTVGGAFEGVLAGIPSAAISVEAKGIDHVDTVAQHAVGLLQQLLSNADPAVTRSRLLLYNINYPGRAPADAQGIKIVPQGRCAFIDEYEMRIDPRDRTYYWLSGVQGYVYPPGSDEEAEDDLRAVQAGYIAVTPLRFDLNCEEELERLSKLELGPNIDD